ncbi:MAG: outer membrane beta-barrel protein [Arenicellales bacterium]
MIITKNSRFRSALKLSLLGGLSSLALLASPLSYAESTNTEQTTWFGEVADGQWLAGLKLGAAEPSTPGYSTAQTTTLVVGYQFSRPVGDSGSSSIELEFTTSNDADIEGGVGGDWDMHSTGLYFNYRTPGTVYFKGKLGILDSNVHTRFPTRDFQSHDANMAFGLGLGVRMGSPETPVNIEAEWISSAGDHDINHFSISGLMEF